MIISLHAAFTKCTRNPKLYTNDQNKITKKKQLSMYVLSNN